MTRRSMGVVLALLGLILPSAQGQTDLLPSWNEGASKRAILDFVNRVTREGGPEFVPVADRIAAFDNDGTLGRSFCDCPRLTSSTIRPASR